MKPEPTLADMMIRHWSRSKLRKFDSGHWVTRTVAQARKFVLTESMSAFCADLANCWLPRDRSIPDDPKWGHFLLSDHELAVKLNHFRLHARAPHPVMMIDLDAYARDFRAIEHWGDKPASEGFEHLVRGRRVGYLILQHPKIDTAFMSMGLDSHSVVKGKQEPAPMVAPFASCWTVDDSVPPWPPAHPAVAPGAMDDGPLTGPITMTPSPWVRKQDLPSYLEPKRFMHELLNDGSNMRFLWTLLTAINDIPVLRRHVVPASGHMAGGSYKRFMDHTVLDLAVPKHATVQMAKRVLRLTSIRVRAHLVRGHFRRHYMFPLNPLCDHRLEPIPDTQMNECKLCGGRKMWITEHQAGDASLGWADHDYAVHHKGKT